MRLSPPVLLLAILASAYPVELAAQSRYPSTSILVTIGQSSLGDSVSGPTTDISLQHSFAEPLILFGRVDAFASGPHYPGTALEAAAASGGLQLVTVGRWAQWLLLVQAGPGAIRSNGATSFAWLTAAGVGVEMPLGTRLAIHADLRLGGFHSTRSHNLAAGSIGVRF